MYSFRADRRRYPLDLVVGRAYHENRRLLLQSRRVLARHFRRAVGGRNLPDSPHRIQFLEPTFRIATQFLDSIPVVQLSLSLYLSQCDALQP